MVLNLPVGLDPDGLLRGASAAKGALEDLGGSAQKTATLFSTFEGKANQAFKIGQGGLGLASSVQSVTAAIGSMDLAMVSMAGSRAFLEAGKLAEDFKVLSQNITTVTTDVYGMTVASKGAASAWTTLGAVIQAQPLLVAVTAFTAISSVISLIGANAKQASESVTDLATSLKKTASAQVVDQLLSTKSVAEEYNKKRVDSIRATMLDLYGRNQTLTVSDFDKILNPSRSDDSGISASLKNYIDARRREAIKQGGGLPEGFAFKSYESRFNSRTDLTISAQRQLEFLRQYARQYQTDVAEPDRPLGLYEGPPRPPLGTALPGYPKAFGPYPAEYPLKEQYTGLGPYLPGTTEDAMVRASTIARLEEIANKFKESGREWGEYVGDAAADLLLKMRSAGDIAKAIGQDIARGLLKSGLGSIGSYVGGFFAPKQPSTGSTDPSFIGPPEA